MNASLDGFLSGLSLIVAIGAQNAYVLKQGLRRAYIGPVVTICTLSDYVLIVAGVSGIGLIVQHAGWTLQAVRWFGVAFLAWYVLYVLLVAYARPFMNTKVFGNINVGLLFGLLQFVSTFAIAIVYARYADRKMDPLAAELRPEIEGSR